MKFCVSRKKASVVVGIVLFLICVGSIASNEYTDENTLFSKSSIQESLDSYNDVALRLFDPVAKAIFIAKDPATGVITNIRIPTIGGQNREGQQTVPSDLPEYVGVTTSELIELVKGWISQKDFDMSREFDFAVRSRELLTNTANFRDASTKWLHPKGVCAQAIWEINEDTGATGLFSKGTKVPAVLRISSGTHESRRLKADGTAEDRLYGMAIKLFHINLPAETNAENFSEEPALGVRVRTSNILTLDNYGFIRSNRPYIMQPQVGADGNQDELFFSNNMPVKFLSDTFVKSALGKVLSKALDIFDDPNFARPMYVTAGIDSLDRNIAPDLRRTPFEVRFESVFAAPRKDYDDYRMEILDYEGGYFKIIIYDMNKDDGVAEAREVGKLRIIGQTVVSNACDLQLAFHHSPNQWKTKYESP